MVFFSLLWFRCIFVMIGVTWANQGMTYGDIQLNYLIIIMTNHGATYRKVS